MNDKASASCGPGERGEVDDGPKAEVERRGLNGSSALSGRIRGEVDGGIGEPELHEGDGSNSSLSRLGFRDLGPGGVEGPGSSYKH